MERNFSNCRFKLTLPTIVRNDGMISIMFSVQPLHGAEGLLVMQECRIVDSFGEIKEQYNPAFKPSTIELSKGQQKIVVHFSERINKLKRVGMNLEYTLLDMKMKKKIKVYYEIINDLKKNLMGVEVEDCNIDTSNDFSDNEEELVIPLPDYELDIEKKREIVRKYIRQLKKDNEQLKKEHDILKSQITQKNQEIEELKQKLKLMKPNDQLRTNNMETHLNEILDYMERTAISCGITLSNIYVYTSTKDGKNHVNVRGEIYFANGVEKLSSGLKIKASLYDANGHIEIEGNAYVSTSFSGYDTFDIGWNGGTKESWLSETKIRLFVVKA